MNIATATVHILNQQEKKVIDLPCRYTERKWHIGLFGNNALKLAHFVNNHRRFSPPTPQKKVQTIVMPEVKQSMSVNTHELDMLLGGLMLF